MYFFLIFFFLSNILKHDKNKQLLIAVTKNKCYIKNNSKKFNIYFLFIIEILVIVIIIYELNKINIFYELSQLYN